MTTYLPRLLIETLLGDYSILAKVYLIPTLVMLPRMNVILLGNHMIEAWKN